MNYPLLCSTCRQKIGLAGMEHACRTKVFCSEFCSREQAVTELEERNDAWQVLRAHGRKPVMIARLYDSPHGLVYKTLDRLEASVDNADPVCIL